MDETGRYPRAYIDFLAEFHGSRDFFECHEIMEEFWKEEAGSAFERCWLALIRISVACYHARRGNWSGARKMLAKAMAETDAARMEQLGMDGGKLKALLAALSEEWEGSKEPVYRDPDLPIRDPLLLRAAVQACESKGWAWTTPSEKAAPEVVNRHLTRDRSGVVEARRLAAESKRRSGS